MDCKLAKTVKAETSNKKRLNNQFLCVEEVKSLNVAPDLNCFNAISLFSSGRFAEAKNILNNDFSCSPT